MDFVDLRSDTVTKPTEAMREAMANAVVGDDVFGEDPTVNQLEELAAERVGKERALFLPSGTMGNQVAALSHTTPGDEVIVHTCSHIFLYEAGGLGRLGGLQVRIMEGDEKDYFPREGLRQAIRGDNIHFPRTGMIAMENTVNRLGGRVYGRETMAYIYGVAKEHGLPVHLDGARIFNAAISLLCDVKDLCCYTDSVMFCLSKGLGAPVGSMLAGASSFIDKARRMRKLLGGGMRQAGVIAAAGIVALETMVDGLQEDHRRAKELALGLNKIPGFKVDLEGVQSNIVVLDFQEKKIEIEDFIIKAKEVGVLVTPFGEHQARLVTHHQIDDAAVSEALDRLEAL